MGRLDCSCYNYVTVSHSACFVNTYKNMEKSRNILLQKKSVLYLNENTLHKIFLWSSVFQRKWVDRTGSFHPWKISLLWLHQLCSKNHHYIYLQWVTLGMFAGTSFTRWNIWVTTNCPHQISVQTTLKGCFFFAPELGIKYDLTSHIKVLKMLNFNFDGKRTVTHPYHILNLIHSMENKVQLCHIPNFLSSKGPGKRDFILCCSCDNTSMISLKLPHKL